MARNNCKNLYGDLATITSKEENDFVKDLVRSVANDGDTGAFIKATYSTYMHAWTTSLYKTVTFSDWASPTWSPPTNTGRRYIHYCAMLGRDNDWAWVPQDCAESQGMVSVCERSPGRKECHKTSCYKLFTDTFFFHAIEDTCKNAGGYVLEINSKEESDFINGFLGRASVPWSKMYGALYRYKQIWLGVTDKASEGEFRLMSNGGNLDFENWIQGEPKTKRDSLYYAADCVVLNDLEDWKWRNVLCRGERALVCESTNVNGITG
ncbi:macrophage mannose receptor 1 [Elysia marginata]|uniref:Macrophage mannose receptor 1 n=1 Tax=Elysia marginata TaxID=1093978 RepID=A0AAV4FKW9_9GAST|nr:macrophage mannose receptor 1 [Elysia marginata]